MANGVYRCERCKVEKPAKDFHRNEGNTKRWSRDGLATTCKVCRREYQRIWRHRNRASVAASAARRRELAPKIPRALTSWVRTLLRDPCPYCGRPSQTVEHVVPVSLGGAVDETNLVGACRPCNSSKGPKSLLSYLLWSA